MKIGGHCRQGLPLCHSLTFVQMPMPTSIPTLDTNKSSASSRSLKPPNRIKNPSRNTCSSWKYRSTTGPGTLPRWTDSAKSSGRASTVLPSRSKTCRHSASFLLLSHSASSSAGVLPVLETAASSGETETRRVNWISPRPLQCLRMPTPRCRKPQAAGFAELRFLDLHSASWIPAARGLCEKGLNGSFPAVREGSCNCSGRAIRQETGHRPSKTYEPSPPCLEIVRTTAREGRSEVCLSVAMQEPEQVQKSRGMCCEADFEPLRPC